MIREAHFQFLTFSDYLSFEPDERPSSFCMIRHDVDRRLINAVKMAELEAELGVFSSFYFRKKRKVFSQEIFKYVAGLGHEVGYHYECLCDSKGDLMRAYEIFEEDLSCLQSLADVKTVCMHGRPFSKFDSRDMWVSSRAKSWLHERFGLLGELYLDIDYTNIAYLSDTGRTWHSGRNNRRDRVDSLIACDFESFKDLTQAISKQKFSKIVLQVHPERWDDSVIPWSLQLIKDSAVNFAKRIVL